MTKHEAHRGFTVITTMRDEITIYATSRSGNIRVYYRAADAPSVRRVNSVTWDLMVLRPAEYRLTPMLASSGIGWHLDERTAITSA